MDSVMLLRIFLALFLFTSLNVYALDKYVFAQLIHRDEMSYPREAQTSGWEGWVYYSYEIGKEGQIQEIRIVDSNGVKAFERVLKKYIESHVYKPATLNGEPIEEPSGVLMTRFVLTNIPRAADKKFARQYIKAKNAVHKGHFDEVEDIINKLEGVSHRCLYEELYLQSLYVAYFNGIGDSDRAYLHTKRVLDFRKSREPDPEIAENEYYVPFLVSAYQYEVNAMMIGDALTTAALLAAIAPENETANRVILHSNQLAERVKGKQFSIEGHISRPVYGGDQGRLVFRLLNKEIEMSDLVGNVDDIRIICDKGGTRLEYSEGESWPIPKEWGACRFYIVGQVGTKFTLTERPS